MELKKDGIKRLDLFFEEKRKFLENLVRELREGELSREKTLSVKKWIDDFEKDLDKEHEALKLEQTKIDERLHSSKEKYKAPQNPDLREGTRVIVKSLNRNGELIREEKKGKWLVAVDNLKLTIAEDNIEACENQEKLKLSKPIVSIISDTSAPSSRPSFELRLLGMRAEEAQKALQDQMDLALVHGITEFAIIHGKGHGILQELSHDFLKRSPYVKAFRFAKPEEGGSGKTIVSLG